MDDPCLLASLALSVGFRPPPDLYAQPHIGAGTRLPRLRLLVPFASSGVELWVEAPRLPSPSSSVSSEREEVSSRAAALLVEALFLREGGGGGEGDGEVRTSDDARDSIGWVWEGTEHEETQDEAGIPLWTSSLRWE